MVNSFLTIHLDIGGDHHEICYRTLEEALADDRLADLLDAGVAVCTAWSGSIRLTSRPVVTGDELREALTENATTIRRCG